MLKAHALNENLESLKKKFCFFGCSYNNDGWANKRNILSLIYYIFMKIKMEVKTDSQINKLSFIEECKQTESSNIRSGNTLSICFKIMCTIFSNNSIRQ